MSVIPAEACAAAVLATGARYAAALVTLPLLAIGLVLVALVVVISPTPDRRAVAASLGQSIRDLAAVVAGTARQKNDCGSPAR